MQLTCADAQHIPAICVIRLLRHSFPCDVILHHPGDLQPVCPRTYLFLPLHTALLSLEGSVHAYVFFVLGCCMTSPPVYISTHVSCVYSIV